jgi:hypothetical protein
MISTSGMAVRSATSKRTWSLPAPVEPWAIRFVPVFFGILQNEFGLNKPFGTDTERIGSVAQYIAFDQVRQNLVVEPGEPVYAFETGSPQMQGTRFNLCFLFCRETDTIHDYRVNFGFIALFEVGYTEACVKTTAVGYYYGFVHKIRRCDGVPPLLPALSVQIAGLPEHCLIH